MSAEGEADEVMCCASCGQAEIDDIKLKNCDGGCDLVKYCSDDCLSNHREQHEKECMQRLAELRDDDLFTMPDCSHLGECPICCLPQPIEMRKSRMMVCCSKLVCNGCDFANQMREVKAGLETRCVFCRQPTTDTPEGANKYMMKRIKKNCPVAMREMGQIRYREGDYQGALEYWTKAVELGNISAHYNLSEMYTEGEAVDKDMKRAVHHWEQAAIGGHPNARFNLGVDEWNNGRFERARKHLIIAANLGHEKSLKCVKDLYAYGHASKEDYATALRAYQAAVDATKSAERETADTIRKLAKAAPELFGNTAESKDSN
jgi:tetratricopeptide (TPR) repeat protein